jgi:hypothetical protein
MQIFWRWQVIRAWKKRKTQRLTSKMNPKI